MTTHAPSFTPIDALKRAVALLGSQAAMARLLGLKQPSVWNWIDKGKPLPAQHVLKVEAATGIPKEDLRPDIYPRDAATSPASGGGASGGAGGASTASRADRPTPESLSGLSA